MPLIAVGSPLPAAFEGLTLDVSANALRNNGVYFGGIATINAAVPETETWAMMIVGLGAVGGAMRRRVRVAFA